MGGASTPCWRVLVLVLLARTLPADEYAVYVSAFALLEITMLMSSLGMEWVTGIYIPPDQAQGCWRRDDPIRR